MQPRLPGLNLKPVLETRVLLTELQYPIYCRIFSAKAQYLFVIVMYNNASLAIALGLGKVRSQL